jgi:hypothetical protein
VAVGLPGAHRGTPFQLLPSPLLRLFLLLLLLLLPLLPILLLLVPLLFKLLPILLLSSPVLPLQHRSSSSQGLPLVQIRAQLEQLQDTITS